MGGDWSTDLRKRRRVIRALLALLERWSGWDRGNLGRHASEATGGVHLMGVGSWEVGETE